MFGKLKIGCGGRQGSIEYFYEKIYLSDKPCMLISL